MDDRAHIALPQVPDSLTPCSPSSGVNATAADAPAPVLAAVASNSDPVHHPEILPASETAAGASASPLFSSGRDPNTVRRFRSKVNDPNASGCTLWNARIRKDGYGSFSIKRRPYQAHRVAWSFFCGEIPDELFVLHKCDVRACVNTEHLFLGTQQDNMDDMQKKGRRISGPALQKCIKRGEQSHRAKLSDLDAIEILKRRSVGETFRSLSSRFSVSIGTVSSLVYGHSWRHLSRSSLTLNFEQEVAALEAEWARAGILINATTFFTEAAKAIPPASSSSA
jgi:hypothetical protein